MLKGRERHGIGEVIAVDRNYVPMQEVSRRRALCAEEGSGRQASGRQ